MSYMGKVRPTIALTSDDIEDGAILNVDVNASAAIANSKMATDTTNATNLASGTVPTARLGSGTASSSTFLTGAQTYAAVDTSGITANQDDIALLGFKVAANGSLARYNLVDQSIDAFEDASGVDASASTNEVRNASNYYSGSVAGAAIQAFKTTGSATYTASAGIVSVEVLVVGGGGGGGSTYHGGGGGAGGIVHDTDFTVIGSQAYGITVGAYGARGDGSVGTNGGDSSFDNSAVNLKLIGLGGGGGAREGAGDGLTGGSGGGGTLNTDGGASTQADFAGATSYGSAGGDGTDAQPGNTTGGGGGASAAGTGGTTARSGDGGAGQLFSTFVAYGSTSANAASTGSDGGYFGGGGGGSTAASSGPALAGLGGVGGGADGDYENGNPAPPWSPAGEGGTGGGGGGGERGGSKGGNGDNGGVYVKENDTNLDMTLVSNAQTAESAPTTGDLVMTISNGTGTTTPNTDIKAYISRDGSAYSSAVTLVDQGDTGGHTILTANGVDLSGIASGTSMRWKIETLNQGVSKNTRIQAVSLGWS